MIARSLPMCALAIALLASRSAAAADADAAREELRAGYALKQQGDCRGALPHLLASYRLDPMPKAVLNAADCEQRLGDFVAARGHAQEGLDLATRQSDAELAAIAHEQLTAVDKRVARITIVTGSAIPVSASIDGVAASVAALTMLNPGKHEVVAHAAGHLDRTYPVTLGEGARETIEVTAGEAVMADATPLAADAGPSPVSTSAPRDAQGASRSSSVSGRQLVALTVGGAGVVAVGIGGVFGVMAKSTYDGAHCPACTRSTIPQGAYDQATVATVAFIAGGVLAAGGAILYFTAPRVGAVGIAPTFGPKAAGLGVTGGW